MIINFARRLFRQNPTKLNLIIIVNVISGFLEGLGVTLFIPLLSMIESKSGDPSEFGRVGSLIKTLFSYLHLPLNLSFVVLSIFLIIVFTQLFIILGQKITFDMLTEFDSDLRVKLYTNVFNAEWPFFFVQKTGDLINSLTTEVARIRKAFNSIIMIFSTSIVIVVYIILAFGISVKMTLFTILAGTIIVSVLRPTINRATSFGNSILQANAMLQNESIEHISGAKVIKSYSAEKTVISRFKRYVDKLVTAQFASGMNQAWLRALFETFTAGILAAGIYLAVIHLNVKLANLIVFLFVIYRLAPRLANIQSDRHSLLENVPALNRLDNLIEKAKNSMEKNGTKKITKFTKNIKLKDVTYCYQDDHPVLDNINLQIEKGKTIALVGVSGSGKTSVIDLIIGLLKPGSGDVLIDDISISEVDIHSWRNIIGYISQDTILFNDTVRSNIIWTAPDVTESDMLAAAKLAYVDEFVNEMPDGYDTIIGDRGVRLSGGQKQRLALARAIVRRPQVLILDEATSALDAESEMKIKEAIELLASTITIIIVTHRLATVKNADKIYVLKQGKIIEDGTWNQLTTRIGNFESLWQLQRLE